MVFQQRFPEEPIPSIIMGPNHKDEILITWVEWKPAPQRGMKENLPCLLLVE
ncbi:hypothetical protein AALO_G00144150 [Alosa alosa]|uniref:Uncharacterized protein n=1 Tax=Alosa alosa TaxID=278164 RepID=A0AAV6GN61_9TELE|nr:hypothetical protein AALO_G00144150 [Alosa alosa]